MVETHTSRTLKKRRRAARKEVLATIAGLPDTELRNMLHELGREVNQRSNAMNEVRTRLDAVRGEIEKRETLTSVGVHISDHAIVRYLERYKGLDVRAIREEIAAMARRSGKLNSGEQYARRQDDETGLTIGINEITNVVTTVFSEKESAVLDTE